MRPSDPLGPDEPADLSLWLVRPPRPGTPAASRLAVDELDASENGRADLFVHPRDRLQYLAAHIALRRVLAARTGCPPGALRLGREPGPPGTNFSGRPVLVDPPAPVHFSLSHSHGLILIGAASVVVGVDVQRVPTLQTVQLCGPSLHPAEWSELAKRPAARQPAAFGRLWARKEAYLKGLGTGLRRSPALDYVGDAADVCAPPKPFGWIVRDVPVGPQYTAAAALAVATEPTITLRSLPVSCLYGGNAGQPLSAAPLLAWRRKGSWTLRWSSWGRALQA
uniref:Putative phosphopantetheinyl transferase n=1 Tax=Streptomyces sp. 2238-SVT4 TaxID=681626 RepID=D5MRJ0_9ACTN|nr:putative phosphopantetheinyl transferase [Streptomyces sp. 2238-SVT4]